MRAYFVHIFKAWLLIPFLNLIGNKKGSKKTKQELKSCQDGTLGRELYDWLNYYQIELIPRFENHDVKHVLTGYKSEGLDEIRLQVFMLGNGNYSLTCLLLCMMALIFPEHYATFKTDFAKGSLAKPLKNVDINIHRNQDLRGLREELNLSGLDKLVPRLEVSF